MSIIRVKEVLPDGIRKITFPVAPAEPAGKFSGSVVSVVGALVASPDFKRM